MSERPPSRERRGGSSQHGGGAQMSQSSEKQCPTGLRRKPEEHVRMQQKDVSKRRMIRMAVKRQVLTQLYLNFMCALGQVTNLSAPLRSPLECFPIRAAFPGHPILSGPSGTLYH